jgi:hypothetical protein
VRSDYRPSVKRAVRRIGSVASAAAVLLVACSSDDGCVPTPSANGSCADLRFDSRDYDEWREVDPPSILQEVGNATYPACNAAESCGEDLGGLGATDVWLFKGADVADAVIGLREGTHVYVIFVRVGVDPDDL